VAGGTTIKAGERGEGSTASRSMPATCRAPRRACRNLFANGEPPFVKTLNLPCQYGY
jgi:hypothetical protein